MKIYGIVILAILNIFLLMGIVSTVCSIGYDVNHGPISVYLGAPMTGGDCMSCLQGKTVDLYHISTEHSQMPSNWCVVKGGPSNEISFKQPYDVVRSGMTDWRSIYQIKMTLDENNRVEDIKFYKNSVRVPFVPEGLWDFALQKLDAR